MFKLIDVGIIISTAMPKQNAGYQCIVEIRGHLFITFFLQKGL